MKSILKRFVAVILVLFICMSVFATDVQTLLEEARKASREVQGYERTRENAYLVKRESEVEGTKVTVKSGTTASADAVFIGSTDGTGNTVSVVFPEIGDNIFITTGMNVSNIYLSKSAALDVTPTVSVQKNFNLKTYEDTRTDIQDKITDIQAEYSYESGMISFENAFYQAVINIIKAQSSISQAEREYIRTKSEYEASVKAGFIREGSLTALKTEMSIESSLASIESSKESLENLLLSFKNKYGIEYTDVTEVREPSVEITPSSEKSSSVRLAELALESAKQEYEAKNGHASVITASASLSPEVSFDSNMKYSQTVLGAALSAGFTDDNWTVSASLSDSIDFESAISPVLTVSGKWTNDDSRPKTDEIAIKKLANTVLEKQAALTEALNKYEETLAGLQVSADDYRASLAQLKVRQNYNDRYLEAALEQFASGLCKERDLEDALYEVEEDEKDALILSLQGLIIENNIKLLNI
ncbi:MAG: hypothetical protein K5634_02475 [Sphaerochaetaceae bacterium]|nr:hypothetical protein [Sphaerochaetaceae bacterium]